MQHLFDSQVYADRREKLHRALPGKTILICGNGEAPMNYKGNPYAFRQDSNFLYYAGLQIPNLHISVDGETGETTLYGEDLTAEDVVWMGPRPSLEELAELVGIQFVKPLEYMVEELPLREVHCLPPYRTEHFRLMQQMTQKCNCSMAPSIDLVRAVIAQREFKEQREIEQMEHSLAITAEMHERVMRAARPGMTEAALVGIAEGIAAANHGAPAYGSIITRNGHILHNHRHDNVMAEGDLILCDFGAENAMGYASDITRTFPVSASFSARQRDIYRVVLDAQLKAIDAIAPGVTFREVHLLSARIIAEGLVALGLMKGNAAEAVEAGAHALFFPHGLGHMIGLDVHDMEGLGEDLVGYDDNVERSTQFGLGYLRMAKELKPGHVVTVEPGIYFIPELIDRWKSEGRHNALIDYDKVDAYRGFGGIRIEDNILVTTSGHKVLGSPIPKTVEEVEHLRATGR